MQTKPAPRSNPTDITVTEAVDLLIERALERGASDVHIEPRERTVVVRYRIDGWLQEAAKFPLKRYAGVAKQICARTGLQVGSRIPQQAATPFASDYGSVMLDIATMPTVNGEKIVIHLKPQAEDTISLEGLGYWGNSGRLLRQAIAEPHGLVLAGSLNKTSLSVSLLAMVHALNNPAYNIATLESPVTHRLSGVTQTELKPGASYGEYLLAALKTDPNVVMVGSLQDPATVRLGVQTALDGRLLLGGVHASDTGRAIKHVQQLHGEPYMVAAGLKAATSQRFIRKLCLHCRQAYLPGPDERRRLSGLLTKNGIKTVAQVHELELMAIHEKLGYSAEGTLLPAASSSKRISQLWRAAPHGCADCRFTGYFGRQGVVETLIPSDKLRDAVAAKATPATLRRLAVENGMATLALDGFIKALRGLTSTEELFAACA